MMHRRNFLALLLGVSIIPAKVVNSGRPHIQFVNWETDKDAIKRKYILVRNVLVDGEPHAAFITLNYEDVYAGTVDIETAKTIIDDLIKRDLG